MKARASLLLVMALLFASCRADAIELNYQYDSDVEHLEYILTARANAEWQIGEPGRGSYTVRFQVDEAIQPQEGGGAIVDVTMTPLEVEENGLLPPGSEERRFRLELGPNGEKLNVLEVGGIAAVDLDPSTDGIVKAQNQRNGGRFARTGYARHDCEGVVRDVHRDVFQIVLFCAKHFNELHNIILFFCSFCHG